MNPIQKRFLLFLIGCIGLRVLVAILAKNMNANYLPILGYVALLPAFGFMYIYLTGARKTGIEVGGDQIWWNDLRPLHSALYFVFSYNAIYKRADSWKYLAADVLIGLVAFLNHHAQAGDFSKLM
jgi:hypothetical protein